MCDFWSFKKNAKKNLMSSLYAVLLAGGSGTRLWPLTSQSMPKQFLEFRDGKNLLQLTYLRMQQAIPDASIIIMTTQVLAEQTRIVMHQFPADYIIEPAPRNTGAAVFWAAQSLAKHDPEALMIIVPSDHHINNQAAFADGLSKAVQAAGSGALVLLGAAPTFPSTEYGYISYAAPRPDGSYSVQSFHEKPNLTTATQYLSAGCMVWNMGIVVARACVIIDEYMRHQAALYNQILTNDIDAYLRLPPLSFDVAVLEKTTRAAVVPVDCGWTDVGSIDTFLQFSQSSLFSIQYNEADNTQIITTLPTSISHLKNMRIIQTQWGILIQPLPSQNKQNNDAAAVYFEKNF